MPSAKFLKALQRNKVVVKKNVSGEVRISFQDINISDINLTHGNPEDLTSYTGVTADVCRKSNIDSLINANMIRII